MKRAFVEPERVFAANLLAQVKALSWLYQTSHWQTRGKLFYQDHLLFERLYESATGFLDKLAEKVVGLYGWQTVDAPDSAMRTTNLLKIVWQIPDPIERALALENTLQRFMSQELENDGMPTGWRVLLEDMLDQQDEHFYLLGQRNSKEASLERRWHSARNPEQWQQVEDLPKTAGKLYERESQMWEQAIVKWLKENPRWDDPVRRLDALTYAPPTKVNLEKFMATVPKVKAPWVKRLRVFMRNMLFGSYTREFKFMEGPNSMISTFFSDFREALHHYQGGRVAASDFEEEWFNRESQ